VLAVILWLVIHQSLRPTASPSNFQFGLGEGSSPQGSFKIDIPNHGNPKK
jgi:hypothetical protein